MIVADRLGVDPDDVEVLHSDTAISPLGPRHLRLAVAGRGWRRHLPGHRQGDRQGPAHRRPPDGGRRRGPRVRGRHLQRPGLARPQRCPLAAVAFEAFTAHNLPDGVEPNLEAHVTYDPPNFSWPVRHPHLRGRGRRGDRRGRGACSYVAVDDCGNQINPLIVEGQVHGGVVQGLAQALYEEAVYDDDGNLTTSTPGRLPGAGGLGRAVHHHRIDHHPEPDQPAGRQGHRRGRHDRRRPGRHQRRGRRPGAARGDRRRHAGVTPARVVRHPVRRPGQPPEEPDDPRRLRLRPGRLRPTRPSRCSPSTATRPSSSPAATRCCR